MTAKMKPVAESLDKVGMEGGSEEQDLDTASKEVEKKMKKKQNELMKEDDLKEYRIEGSTDDWEKALKVRVD